MEEFLFNDLLPESIKNDAKIKAISKCMDYIFSAFNGDERKLLIYSRIDELDEQTLDDIAWGWGLNYETGYNLLETIEEKRALVKNALQIHKHKGTRFATERAAKLLNITCEIIEWWEDETGELEPFEFRVDAGSDTRDLTPEFFANLNKLVNATKNVRSHMKGVRAILAATHVYSIGVASLGAAFVEVFPKIEYRVTVKINSELLQDAINNSVGNWAVINGAKIPFNGNSFVYVAEEPGEYTYTVYISGAKSVTGTFKVGE